MARARQLGSAGRLAAAATATAAPPAGTGTGITIPPEFSGPDYVAFLLHIDAEIEHGLMIQYLYGAYSLGGPHVPECHREKVRGWQEIMLGISKEEMGHLISVQNVLRLIGAPLNFGRDDYPWDTPFYPFPFRLEPLSLDSLAKYVFAESPVGWIDTDDPMAQEIRRKVFREDFDPHTVSALFGVLGDLIADPAVIPDEVFQGSTYPFQASFDEWGRGYQNGARGNTSGHHMKNTPNVLVVPLASRDDAVGALKQIAEQGENTTAGDIDQPSHFERFLRIYRELRALTAEMADAGHKDWRPSRNLPVNPWLAGIASADDATPPASGCGDRERDQITNPEAMSWASLLNLRYRMLLNFLTHSFLLQGGNTAGGANSPRGLIINSAFGEMYNLRSITHALIELPLGKGSPEKVAGPPFTIPYTLELPAGEVHRWRVHGNLIDASAALIEKLLVQSPRQEKYLRSLQETDRKLRDAMVQLTARPSHLQ